MDEWNKIIRELEDKLGQDMASWEEMLEKLGEKLLKGLDGQVKKGKPRKKQAVQTADSEAEDSSGDSSKGGGKVEETVDEYRSCLSNISDNGEQIIAIEKEESDFQTLISDITRKEIEFTKGNKELHSLYTQTGRLALSDSAFEEFASIYKTEADSILANVELREARLEELEQKTGNIFTRIGKNAESLVVKTLLSKNQADLNRVYRSAGERFIIRGEDYKAGEGEIRETAGDASRLKRSQDDLASEIAMMKEDRKKTLERFRGEGNPARRIQALEKMTLKLKGEKSGICRRFGGFTFEKEYSGYFGPLMGEEEKKIAERAAAFRMSADENSVRIEKLKAAVAIDSEKAGIERLKKSIDSEESRIQAAHEAITGMEKEIKDAEKRIAELTKLL